MKEPATRWHVSFFIPQTYLKPQSYFLYWALTFHSVKLKWRLEISAYKDGPRKTIAQCGKNNLHWSYLNLRHNWFLGGKPAKENAKMLVSIYSHAIIGAGSLRKAAGDTNSPLHRLRKRRRWGCRKWKWKTIQKTRWTYDFSARLTY